MARLPAQFFPGAVTSWPPRAIQSKSSRWGVFSACPSPSRNSSTVIFALRTIPRTNCFANSAPPICWPRQIPPSTPNGVLQSVSSMPAPPSAFSLTGLPGQTLAFFQNEGMNLQERSARGNDYLDVVLPQTPARNLEFTLHFHYRGNVIQDAGNGVLFVGARESWYPHLGDSAEFSSYDFLLRWPRKLRLIATGSKLEEHEEGEFRVGHWKAEKPISAPAFHPAQYPPPSFSPS